MSRYEAVPHPRDPKLVYYRKVKGASEPQVVPVKKSSRQSASSVVPAKRPPRKSASGVVPAKRPKGEKRVVPAVRPTNPGKVVPVFRRKTEIELKGPATAEWQQYGTANYNSGQQYFSTASSKSTGIPLNSFFIRGEGYPSNYYGFVGNSYISVKAASGKHAKLQFNFGNDIMRSNYFKLKSNLLLHIDLYRDNKTRNLHNFPWPINAMATDLLDNISIIVESGKRVKISRVKIVLNKITICDISFSPYPEIDANNPLHLAGYIRNRRLNMLREYTDSSNPILHAAALEWGKSWSPKYGGVWLQNDNGEWYVKPVNWCSEFASWAIRQGSNLEPPIKFGSNTGTYDIARYFIGQGWGTDLYNSGKINIMINGRGTHIGDNRFITPNNQISLWDPDEERLNKEPNRKKYDFVGMAYRLYDPINIELNRNRNRNRNWIKNGKPSVQFTFYKSNPCQCSYNNLPNQIKPGFYVKLKRGTITEPIHGHSTLFVDWTHLSGGEWVKGFVRDGYYNYFWGLGGNQDDRVKVKTYDISKSTSKTDIFWKASSDATGAYGYQDGFGDTTSLLAEPMGMGGD